MMFERTRIHIAVSGLVMSGVLVPQLTWAAEQLEEVIVTAQKRSENLQAVPISVQSMSTAELEKNSIVTVSDLSAHVPGLNVAPYPGSSETLYPSIRGVVPNSLQVSAPIPMAVHINGVYIPQTAGLNVAAADLERVEVLKGPQGVMSGRNATGGALNIYTAKPEMGQFAFKQQFTAAQLGQFLSKTMVNVPLGESLAARVSYLHSDRDNEGVKNSAPGGIKFGEKTGDAARLDVRWKPVKNVTVDYGYDTSTSKSYDTPNQCQVAGNNIVFGGFMAYMMADPRVAAYAAGCRQEKQDSLYYPYAMAKNRNKAEGHTLNLDWEVNPSLNFRSITGYRKVDTSNNFNYASYAGSSSVVRSDTGAFTILPLGSTVFNGQSTPLTLFSESWSQEFQLLGDVGPNLKYTTGIYYGKEKAHQNSGPILVMYIPNGGGTNVPGADLALVEKKGIASAENTSAAIFGQISWRPDMLEHKLEVVPGIRYTKDRRVAVGYNQSYAGYFVTPTTTPGVVNNIFGFPSAGYASAAGNHSFTNTSPSLSLNYHLNADIMNYVKVVKGYTSGGFDLNSGSPASFAKGFDPETITSVEFGMKGQFLNRRLRTNLAVYQSKYDNEQKTVATLNPASGSTDWVIQNVGKSTYRGLELDITAAVTENLRFGFNSAWLNHRYDQFKDLLSGLDVHASRLLIVPKVSYSVSVDYRFPEMGLPGKLDGNLNLSHRDAQSTPIDLKAVWPASSYTTPAFSLLNGRLALSRIKVGPGGDGHLTVALWGKNLTDKKYSVFSCLNTAADLAASWGEPRTYGIDVVYSY